MHVDLHIGVNAFLTMMFSNLDDHSREFENGPYFLSTTQSLSIGSKVAREILTTTTRAHVRHFYKENEKPR